MEISNLLKSFWKMLKHGNLIGSKTGRTCLSVVVLSVVVLSFCFTILYLNAPVLTPVSTTLDNETFSKSRDTRLITDPKATDDSANATKLMTGKIDTDDDDKNEPRLAEGLYEGKMAPHGRKNKSRFQQDDGNSNVLNYCGVSYSDSMDLLSMDPIKPLPEFKNPCWYEGRDFKCFPYFFLTGFPKCGTTDIYNRLKQHPQYVPNTHKEYQWLSKTRFYEHITLQDYLRNFDKASETILMNSKANRRAPSHTTQNSLITGDSSATYIFDNDFWMLLPGNRNLTEPVHTNPDYIYHLYPQAKIIVSVRNPIERIWSDFLYQSFSRRQMTADTFHKVVVKAIKLYQDCFNKRSLLSCVYDRKLYLLSSTNTDPSIVALNNWKCPQFLQTNVHLRLGLYSVFIKEYFKIFPRDQIHIVRLEDFSSNMKDCLTGIFDFLGLERLSDQKVEEITQMDRSNTRLTEKKAIGTMKNETRKLLYDFYKPFNEDLARLLNDQRFNYDIR